jgi:hypothetical protein
MTRPHPKVLGSGVRGLRAAVLAAAGISGAVTLTAAMLPQRHFVSRRRYCMWLWKRRHRSLHCQRISWVLVAF